MDAFQQVIGCEGVLQIAGQERTPVFLGTWLNVRKDG
jgi:hypothetical protein